MSVKEQTTIAVLGAGNMGSAMARLLAGNGAKVVLWDHFGEVVDEINRDKRNSRYLPGFSIGSDVSAVHEPIACVEDAETVVIAIPSPFVEDILEQVKPRLRPDSMLVNTVKGLDPKTKRPIHETVDALTPEHPQCLLAGAAIANEFAAGEATSVLLASRNAECARAVRVFLENPEFRASVSDDVSGAAMGGILKNIYALLFGYLDTAAKSGRNLESALISAAVAEMTAIGEAFGARRETIYGRAGLGDLVATCLSQHSHNRKCGRLLGEGKSLGEIETEMGVLPEGIRTAELVTEWVRDHGIRVPLALLVNRIACGGQPSSSEVLESLHD